MDQGSLQKKNIANMDFIELFPHFRVIHDNVKIPDEDADLPVLYGKTCGAITHFWRYPVGLNVGDCCSYALSRSLGEPLLFKGNDFNQTDLEVIAL